GRRCALWTAGWRMYLSESLFLPSDESRTMLLISSSVVVSKMHDRVTFPVPTHQRRIRDNPDPPLVQRTNEEGDEFGGTSLPCGSLQHTTDKTHSCDQTRSASAVDLGVAPGSSRCLLRSIPSHGDRSQRKAHQPHGQGAEDDRQRRVRILRIPHEGLTGDIATGLNVSGG